MDSRFVFFSAQDGAVLVSVDSREVGRAGDTETLAGILCSNAITGGYCSSSIDFCEEEGFAPGAAGEMIQKALECFE